jgi:hypothetical protein
MISIATILLLLSGSSRVPGSPPDRMVGPETTVAPCPEAGPRTRALIEKFLTSQAHVSSREETGTTGVSTSQIRLLTDVADAAVCTRLNEMMGGAGSYGSWVWSYYAAGGRYFVAMKHVNSGGVQRIGWVPLLVYDQDLNRIGAYAM